ncbi:MAG: LysR family transcriptional regulator [Thermomicrobium sp.]|nr:LysR family transcriptional regulator [Thermomicrobium sp.]MDW8059628.1 LysR family transcriptional regulator [Thermomicrobium sp.]
MDVSLRQLQVFRAVARHRSFSRAAEELVISQPAVSAQIKSLEQVLNVPLFQRTGRGVELTEAGRQLLPYAERMLDLLEEALTAVHELRAAQRGRVRVAASTTAGIYVVPKALGAFHRAYPGVELSLDVLNRYAVQQRLLAGDADLAIMGLIEDPQDLEIAQFLPNELVVIASPRHPLARRHRIPLEEIAREPFLVREIGSGTRSDTERIFAEAGFPLRVAMELRSNGAIKQAVAADLGVAVMPRDAIGLELETGRLVVLDVQGFPVRRWWSLVRRAGRPVSPAADALWHFLLQYRLQPH